MTTKIVVLALALMAATSTLLADTLVLTNGRRIQGELTGISGRDIEFEERNGFNRRMLRVPRREIARIEFSDDNDRPFFGQGDSNQGIPRGMRERELYVDSRAAWTDTGIEVRPGQTIYFVAAGDWRWGRNRQDDAAGERNSPRNYLRPMPGQSAAALIGRVGEGDSPFIIGSQSGPFRTRSGGRLFLGINDDVLEDNSGVLRVTVFY
jgi:hypothetical protein